MLKGGRFIVACRDCGLRGTREHEDPIGAYLSRREDLRDAEAELAAKKVMHG